MPLARLLVLFALLLAGRSNAQCELQKIHSPDGAHFEILAQEEDTAVARSEAGVFVYERTPFGWVLTQTLAAPAAVSEPYFWQGGAALDGDTLVVGFHTAWPTDVARVYERPAPGAAFAQIQELTPSGPFGVYDYGERVALEGDVLVVSAAGFPGHAYVYERAGGVWSESFSVHGTFIIVQPTGMGHDVAIDAGRVYLSEYGIMGTVGQGKVHVWEKLPTTGWTEVQAFGTGGNLAVSGDLLVETYDGLLWVHQRIGGAWTEIATPVVPATEAYVPAWLGGAILLGDPESPLGGVDTGALLVLEGSGSAWSVTHTLQPDDVQPGVMFGSSVAAAGDPFLVGASNDGDAGAEAGAVYAWSFAGIACASLTGDILGIDSSIGGAQTLSFEGGAALAGDLYGVLGSLSGFWPGFVVGGQPVPLNPDVYLGLTLAGNAPLLGQFGTLDGAGATSAQAVVAPFPSLAGLTAHHAFGVVNGSLALVHVSNPLPLVFR